MLYGSDSRVSAHISMLAALIHETGHVSASLFIGAKIKRIRVAYDGLRLPLDLTKTALDKELIILLSGPMLNLFCAFFMLASNNAYLYNFGAVNLITALASLFPCHGSDGQRILMNILCKDEGGDCSSIISAIGLFLGFGVLFFSLYISYKTGCALWLSSIYLIYTVLELEKMRKAAFFRKNEKNRVF